MRQPYGRCAQLSALVLGLSIVAIVIILQFGGLQRSDNLTITDLPRIGANLVGACAYWYGYWSYAKAKGYSGWLGTILAVFFLAGLVVLALLRDRTISLPAKGPGQV